MRQASALFGYGHDELVGHSMERFAPSDSEVGHTTFHEGTSPFRRPMGAGLALFAQRRREFPVDRLSLIEDRSDRPLVAAIRDVSERKRAEATRLARARSGRPRPRAAFATAAHQPLQALALLNGALRHMGTEPEAEVHGAAEHAIGTMSRLLNALLDISKLESGP